jgi:putative PIN family toxin of toxin-antitoxin system
MKVFLDTNVLASAIATRGLCADVLRDVFASHALVTSALVLEELTRVLRHKFDVPRELAAGVIALLRQDAVIAEPGPVPGLKLKDKDDLSILSSAVSADADVFVTGDKILLEIGRVGRLDVLSPRQFWEQVAPARPPRRPRRKGRT